MTLERDLVDDLREVAKAMNVMLVEMGQRNARGSGSTVGLPDLAVLCAGKTAWIETKRAHVPGEGHGCLSIGQSAFIERAAEYGVKVHVIDNERAFVELVNDMRRPTWVR